MTESKARQRELAKSRRSIFEQQQPTPKLVSYLIDKYPLASSLGCFISMPTEPDTSKLITQLQSLFKVFAPITQQTTLSWHLVDGNYQTGKYQIPEPTSPETVDISKLVCVIAPALGVDLAGNRLGYGGGYFDRALTGYLGEKIVLVYEADLVESVEPETHDIKVDLIVTENRIIEPRG